MLQTNTVSLLPEGFYSMKQEQAYCDLKKNKIGVA